MLITAYDNFRIAGYCTFNEFVIIWILAHCYINIFSVNELSMHRNQLNNR